MHIPIALYHPGHQAWIDAYDQANDIIGHWLDYGLSHGEDVKQNAMGAVMGWDGCTLAEGIAIAILEAKGFDIEGLVETVEDLRPGETDGDAMARFDREGYTETGAMLSQGGGSWNQ